MQSFCKWKANVPWFHIFKRNTLCKTGKYKWRSEYKEHNLQNISTKKRVTDTSESWSRTCTVSLLYRKKWMRKHWTCLPSLTLFKDFLNSAERRLLKYWVAIKAPTALIISTWKIGIEATSNSSKKPILFCFSCSEVPLQLAIQYQFLNLVLGFIL